MVWARAAKERFVVAIATRRARASADSLGGMALAFCCNQLTNTNQRTNTATESLAQALLHCSQCAHRAAERDGEGGADERVDEVDDLVS